MVCDGVEDPSARRQHLRPRFAALFSRHDDIRYLQHTAGISPRPLTPPEELGKEDILGACAVNLWGALNVLKQGIRAGAFAPRAHGVIILSTSATVGSEGRAASGCCRLPHAILLVSFRSFWRSRFRWGHAPTSAPSRSLGPWG